MALDLDPVLAYLDHDREGALSRWADLLRLPSVGTDPAYAAGTREAAVWLTSQLRDLGFEAAVRETGGQPAVVGTHPGPDGSAQPRVLYYGHYDVQPADPLELWDTPPFEPARVAGPRGERMVARGAVDNKGQLMTWLEALRGWQVVHGTLPLPATVLIEGEEESGSPSLDPFLERNRADLAADVCIVSDTGMWDFDTPAITCALRGLLYVEVTLRCTSCDLHSGLYGGAVPNALNVLTRIMAGLHDDDGRVQIEGFYDDVLEPEPEERRRLAALGFDETGFLGPLGIESGWGESGYTTLERIWLRPTCDLNGIWGGYTGDGSKTVIPAEGHAKLSFRLVPEQTPEKVLAGVRSYLETRVPPGCSFDLKTHAGGRPLRLPAISAHVRAAERALEATFERPPVRIAMGGSIPAVDSIKRILGIDSLMIGFGLDDDRVHAPNEKFELACFERGVRAHARLLAELARS